jgi:hypothetical protein
MKPSRPQRNLCRLASAANAIVAAGVGAATIFASAAHVEVKFIAGSHGKTLISSGPYDDCPPGTYRNKIGDCVESPDSNRGGATGQCCDGTDTHAENRTGACSRHHGVCQWFAAAGNTGDNLLTGPRTKGSNSGH